MKITNETTEIQTIVEASIARAIADHRVAAYPRHRVVLALVDGADRLDRRTSDEEMVRVIHAAADRVTTALTMEADMGLSTVSALELAEYVGVYATIARILDDADVPKSWSLTSPGSPMTLVERVKMFASTHAVAKSKQLAERIANVVSP